MLNPWIATVKLVIQASSATILAFHLMFIIFEKKPASVNWVEIALNFCSNVPSCADSFHMFSYAGCWQRNKCCVIAALKLQCTFWKHNWNTLPYQFLFLFLTSTLLCLSFRDIFPCFLAFFSLLTFPTFSILFYILESISCGMFRDFFSLLSPTL